MRKPISVAISILCRIVQIRDISLQKYGVMAWLIPFFFYQHFWDLVKKDLMDMFSDFHKGEFDIHMLNFAMLTLVSKKADASSMKKFRPITLLNCSFKIFNKVLTIRLSKILHRLVASNQSTFLKGRYILESVVTAHEVLHSIHSSKREGLVLKIDYEKAFDKVNLEFRGTS